MGDSSITFDQIIQSPQTTQDRINAVIAAHMNTV